MSVNIYKKLIEVRKNIEKLERSGSNAHTKNKYSTLEDYYSASLEPLLKAGLWMYHKEVVEGEKTWLKTYIFDAETNTSVETQSILNVNVDVQKYGAQLTYYRRYHVSCLLCLRADFDDDGESLKDTKMDNGYISQKQLNMFLAMLNKAENAEELETFYLRQMKIDELSKMPKERFQGALEHLRGKVNL